MSEGLYIRYRLVSLIIISADPKQSRLRGGFDDDVSRLNGSGNLKMMINEYAM